MNKLSECDCRFCGNHIVVGQIENLLYATHGFQVISFSFFGWDVESTAEEHPIALAAHFLDEFIYPNHETFTKYNAELEHARRN